MFDFCSADSGFGAATVFRACKSRIRHQKKPDARVTTADAEQTTVAAFRPWRDS
jgi:hypothetical protein